jgi:hypothetical protein
MGLDFLVQVLFAFIARVPWQVHDSPSRSSIAFQRVQ